MCDYSLGHFKSRDAQIGDKLITHNFGTGTIGFVAADAPRSLAPPTVVCVRPGTEIAFDAPVKVGSEIMRPKTALGRVAVFAQINKNQPCMHHDALQFPDGTQVMLTLLVPGQHATVLQLPAKPKTKAEAKAQERVAYVG